MTFTFVNDGIFRMAQGYDKWSHMGGSCVGVCLLYIILRIRYMNRDAMYMAVSLVTFAGIGLELWQGFTGIGFSPLDLLANTIGIWIAVEAVRR